MDTGANAGDPAAADDAGLGDQLRWTVGRLYRRFRSERPEGTLGDTALEVLTRLDKAGPQTLTELSVHYHVAPASMSQTVNRLTSASYAVRTPAPGDRRKVLFATTPAGADLVQAARRQRNAWLDAQLDALPAEDRDVLARACDLLAAITDS
ncbi:MAG: MarR family transcriptional regulator [Actinobacteria bacterium]|nr:MarR family transcriptional regulator [Actinomycetota bacterium]